MGKKYWQKTLLLIVILSIVVYATDRPIIRVGLYQNNPKIFTDSNGDPAGIFIDILNYIAQQEKWEIEYVEGTWHHLLQELENGEIDLMPDIAKNEDREYLYDFNRISALSNWAEIFIPEHSIITSIFDLEGCRIAVMKNDYSYAEFKQNLLKFQVTAEFVEVYQFMNVLRLVHLKKVDAGLCNRLYGSSAAPKYKIKRSSIICCPTELYFAVPKGQNAAILDRIDYHLDTMKRQNNSIYYQTINKWLEVKSVEYPMSWRKVKMIIAGLIVIIIIVGIFWTLMVRRRAKKLLTSHNEISRLRIIRRETQTQLLDKVQRLELIKVLYENFERFTCLSDLADSIESDVPRYLEGFGFNRASLLIQPEIVSNCDNFIEKTRDEQLMKLRHILSGYCCLDQQPVFVNDVTGSSLIPDPLKTPELFKLTLVVPIIREKKVLGSLHLENTMKSGDVSREDVELFVMIARQLAITIHNISLYQENRQALVELDTHRHKLEDIVAARTQELEQKAVELQALNNRLVEMDQLKSIFLASMSHELRTPLNSIVGFTGILLMEMAGTLTDEQKKQLTIVKSSANHLLALINDVLDISKIEADRVVLDISLADPVAVIQECLLTLSPQIDDKKLDIQEHYQDHEPIETDIRRFKQIIMNILSNAVKYTKQGSISIDLARQDSMLEITIRDTGIGMKKSELDHLFQPFQQIDSSLTKKVEGTGLGLYLSQKIAGLMGGRIEADSVYQQGSIFKISLPIRQKERK